MKKALTRLSMTLKAARELGAAQSYWYANYRLGLRIGTYRRQTPIGSYPELNYPLIAPFALPRREDLAALIGDQAADLLAEADEIVQGQIRLFSGPPVALNLAPPDASRHWTEYEGRPSTWGVEDIKYIWEPARFGWVYPLGRAYLLTGNEVYPATFWRYFQDFLTANPVNQGPNWLSAQEVALRLLALLFAAGVFAASPHSNPARMRRLTGAIAAHAARIPSTLSYSRAQNNNHRLSEAVGLYAAGCALPAHPRARHWRVLGWHELNMALRSQIQPDGTYMQHSMNYHRLMLHLALVASLFGRPFPKDISARLSAATLWLLAQVDPISGRAPNLGSNDGANILPLASGGFLDYRPVAQAAARAFLERPAFAPGPWDELGLWLNQPDPGEPPLAPLPESPAVHRLQDEHSWATLRAVHFHSRPSHADQLHVDLWWRGENVALDAGTYRYTAAAPWDNALAQTFVHNTIEVNGQSQMLHAGRFLWLDWAQASILNDPEASTSGLTAQHNGYRRLGILHRRTLKLAGPDNWQVIDRLQSERPFRTGDSQAPLYSFRLNWLLPDWPWQLNGLMLDLSRPRGGQLRLTLSPDLPSSAQSCLEPLSLVRAGEALNGPEDVSPILGWFSPIYGYIVPALSLSLTVRAPLPITLVSNWQFFDGL